MGYLSDRPEMHTNFYSRFDERLTQLRSFYHLARPLFERAKKKTEELHDFQRNSGLDRIARGEVDGKPVIKILEPELVNMIDGYKRKHVSDYDDFFDVYPTLVFIFSYSLFEFYLSDMVRNIYSLNIEYLKSQNKISIEDVIDARTDLHDYLIERECENIRGSYREKMDYIMKRFNIINDDDVKNMESTMIEICEIRNVLVHNDGVINRQFIKNTHTNSYAIGEKINVNKELMDRAVNSIHNFVTLLDREVKKKYFKD